VEQDTIVAVATPPGHGGIGVIRLSGPEALTVLSTLCPRKGPWKSRRPVLTDVVDLAGNRLDHAVVTYYREPRSYTGEDLVEISCHGSPLILDRVVAAALDSGCRGARAGEFTLRAFLSGRIDLTQAEAIVDLVDARSDAGLGLALQQLEGELSRRIEPLRSQLLDVLAHSTALVDFSEDDIPDLALADVSQALVSVHEDVKHLLAGASTGNVLRHGVSIAIVGAPNVGKSSILNALLGRRRAIVTPIAGTTRDTVEDEFQLAGIRFSVIDTAGITTTEDVVESMGIERSHEAIQAADVVLVVLDASRAMTSDDLDAIRASQNSRSDTSCLLACNKSDLPPVLDPYSLPVAGDTRILSTSTLTEDGMDCLREALPQIVLGGHATEGFVVSNARHTQSLSRASVALESALSALAAGLPLDLVSLDMREALASLSAITGVNVDDELLDRVFSRFCIGK
jgi:tRNA modification GTPase